MRIIGAGDVGDGGAAAILGIGAFITEVTAGGEHVAVGVGICVGLGTSADILSSPASASDPAPPSGEWSRRPAVLGMSDFGDTPECGSSSAVVISGVRDGARLVGPLTKWTISSEILCQAEMVLR